MLYSSRGWGRLLTHCLPLPHGIPSKDECRLVLMRIDPPAFQQCISSWLGALKGAVTPGGEGNEGPILAIGGKALRRSFDRCSGLGSMHLVSLWLTQAGLPLAQVAIDEKSNGITAIPEVLKLVDVAGAMITIDAVGTQTAISEQGDFRGDC